MRRLVQKVRFKVFFEDVVCGKGARTAGGRLFHDLGPATANARSPIVDRRVAGTMRSVDDTDRIN